MSDASLKADALGLARFVITGGEPLVMKDFDAVVEAIDRNRHYIITIPMAGSWTANEPVTSKPSGLKRFSFRSIAPLK